MARALADILQELNAGYDPARQLINNQLASLPGQADSQIAGLNAQKDAAFNDITNGARDRGMGFSGIPLADQAKYASTNFLPAVAQVRQSQNDTQNTLLGALNSTNLDQMKYAQGLYQNDLNLDEQKRQFDAQAALQRAQAAASDSGAFLGGLVGGGGAAAPTGGAATPAGAKMLQRPDKGFNFVSQNGQPMSAAQYAAAKGIPFRDLLNAMASAGDQGARSAMTFVGNDYGYDPSKVTSQSLADLYNNLVWGTGKQAAYKPAAAKLPPSTVSKQFAGTSIPGVGGFGPANGMGLRR